MSLQNAVQKNPDWQPKYRSGPKVAVAPPVPYKFFDIGTKMGSYKLVEHVPMRHDTDNIYHPRYIRSGIPPVNTFHAVVHGGAARWVNNVDEWCLEEAWFQHSVNLRHVYCTVGGPSWSKMVIQSQGGICLFCRVLRKALFTTSLLHSPIAGNGHKIGFIVLEFVGTQFVARLCKH